MGHRDDSKNLKKKFGLQITECIFFNRPKGFVLGSEWSKILNNFTEVQYNNIKILWFVYY